MSRFCPGACDGWNRKQLVEGDRSWAKLSLFDYRQFDKTQCASHANVAKMLESRCADLEDVSRIKDRGESSAAHHHHHPHHHHLHHITTLTTSGWAIRRAFVPPHEL